MRQVFINTIAGAAVGGLSTHWGMSLGQSFVLLAIVIVVVINSMIPEGM